MQSSSRTNSSAARGAPPPAAYDPVRVAADLVLRAVAAGGAGRAFLLRRARGAAMELPAGAESRLIRRVVEAFDSGTSARERGCTLLAWAGYVEARHRLGEAGRILELALRLEPTDGDLALHRARIARKAGDAGRAAALYERVRLGRSTAPHLDRMAEIGQALLAAEPEAALACAARGALAAGDPEAAAVAQEERARVRRATGRVGAALRSYATAAARFSDPVDRGRIGHEVADMLVAAGDADAARVVLLATARVAHPDQVERVWGRLGELSQAIGDELGARRWRGARPIGLVALGPPRHRSPAGASGRTARLERRLAGWIGRLAD
jgi:hypothetical protein